MGKKTVLFRCRRCLHCCREVVCLITPFDVILIVRGTGANAREFLEFLTPDEVDGLPKSDPTWLKIGGRRYIMTLRRDRKGCHFLDRRRRACRAYASRPLLCRLFPFKLHETRPGAWTRFSLHKDVGCPRCQDGEVPTDPLYKLYEEDCEYQADYQDLVRVFNRKRYPGKKPEDFIGLFIVTKGN